MQMHESKASTIRSTSTSSSIKLSCTSGGSSGVAGSGPSVTNNLPSNNQLSNSANNNITADRRGKKKSNRDKQPTNDDKATPSVMSNQSSYDDDIEDDHIDFQETINVGNLIIALEKGLEKEKIENEQANSTVSSDIGVKSNTNLANAPSSTSQTATPSSSSSLPSNKLGNITCNNSTVKSLSYSLESKAAGKSNQKSVNKHPRDTGNNNVSSNPPAIVNNNGHGATRTVFKSSSDERGELKMKITRETKPSKNEHKIVTSPSQKSPPSCSSSSSSATGSVGNNLSLLGQINSCEDISTNENSATQTTSSISSTKECGTSTSIGTITEPECLGPCEPGTSVTLEGIVWQETDGGILVVNVTWRGKTYVGALLDCTRHDWAPPRLCDSPTSDIDAKASKSVRAKRIITRSNGIGLDEKNLLQTTGKLRNGKGRRIPSTSDPSSCTKKQRDVSDKSSSENPSAQSETNTPQASTSSTNSETTIVPININTTNSGQPEPVGVVDTLADGASPNSPMLIGCNEPNCSKKYRNMNGLLYHQSHAHNAENESSNNQDDCSSSTKEKVQKTEIDEPPTNNLSSPNHVIEQESPSLDELKANQNDEREQQQQSHQMQHILQSQGQKRARSPSPGGTAKVANKSSKESNMHHGLNDNRLPRNDSPRISYVKGMDPERRHSSSSTHGNVPRGSDARRSPNNHQRHQSYDLHVPSSLASGYHVPQSSSAQASKTNSHSSKPPLQQSQSQQQTQPQPQSQQQPQQLQPPPLPATTEEGMKPSGTSTGPPPAPHQGNCYFNPAFMANPYSTYHLPPYFPRQMFDQMTPPMVPTSNAALLRFMNDMRLPPPPASPSRLLSPSMPKNLPFPPYKLEHSLVPPALSTSHPLPNLSPMSNPPMPPLPAMPPLPGNSANLRMPSQADPLLPPSSQPPFLPPALGLPGIGNPLGPIVGPQVPSIVDDALAKFPRRFN